VLTGQNDKEEIVMFPGHMWGDWWMWLIGVLVLFLFWGGVIALIIYAIRVVARSGRGDNQPPSTYNKSGSAVDILKERYARGEISRDEYLQLRRDLEE
jgi:putative membrane protein